MSVSTSHDPDLDRVIDEAARIWSKEHRRAVSEHPDTDSLVEYQEGKLGEGAAESIRQHLSTCTDCQEEIRALERFDRAPPEEEVEDEMALERSWQAFAAQREKDQQLHERRIERKRWHWPLALAASMLFGVVGVTSFMLSRERSMPTAESSPLVFDLLPEGSSLQRDLAGEIEVSVPSQVDTLVARIHLGDQTPYDAFRLTLTDADGEVLVRRTTMVRDSQGRFALLIPRRSVPEGRYRLVLSGVEGDELTELAVYSFRLRDGE